MKITDALLGEHGVFYAQFDRLQTDIPLAAAVAVVREQAALLSAALISHAHLEDELLFPAMAGFGSDAGVLAAMEEEHRRIHDLLGRALATGELRVACDALLEAVHEAREHFAKEERMVFPEAESLLGPERLRTLGVAWAARRQVYLERAPVP